MSDAIFDRLQQKYQEKEDLVGPDVMRQTERIVMLQVIDNQWKDHLLSMDELKQGIGNRAYGQKDPLVEYKKESYELFTGDDGPHRGRDGPLPVLPSGDTGRPRRCRIPDEDEEEEDEDGEPARPDPNEQQRLAAEVARWRTSRATSSARRKRSWRSCISAATGRTARSRSMSGAKVGPQRPVPLRQRQEVQEVPRVLDHGFTGYTDLREGE